MATSPWPMVLSCLCMLSLVALGMLIMALIVRARMGGVGLK